ncbi:hypothetical protein DB32_006763 [Sandaracinus amylolyticus]|uniref:Uncharacterized protein n=1 Tax=Sandaracinus amylolyticus TaxID=927083 RepID=A0A0F6SH07_9BACT|nr:hypothetical protein DB32_006763 [Sandaracinus amylolyticus]
MFALAGCGSSADPSVFDDGLLRATCGPADGPAIDLVLTQDALGCDTPIADRPSTRLAVYAFGTVDELESIEMERAYTAERCVDGACIEAAGGTLETLRVDGDRAEVRWSIELEDGSLDEGTAWVRVCRDATTRCL